MQKHQSISLKLKNGPQLRLYSSVFMDSPFTGKQLVYKALVLLTQLLSVGSDTLVTYNCAPNAPQLFCTHRTLEVAPVNIKYLIPV